MPISNVKRAIQMRARPKSLLKSPRQTLQKIAEKEILAKEAFQRLLAT